MWYGSIELFGPTHYQWDQKRNFPDPGKLIIKGFNKGFYLFFEEKDKDMIDSKCNCKGEIIIFTNLNLIISRKSWVAEMRTTSPSPCLLPPLPVHFLTQYPHQLFSLYPVVTKSFTNYSVFPSIFIVFPLHHTFMRLQYWFNLLPSNGYYINDDYSLPYWMLVLCENF